MAFCQSLAVSAAFFPHTAENETYRIWNICTSIFCIRSTLDENLLDVIRRRKIERKERKKNVFT